MFQSEDVPEEALIKKPKPKEPVEEEIAVELTIKKPEPTELIEASEKIILEETKPQESVVEEADQLTIKKEVVEETKEETAVTKTKKKSKKPKPDEPVEEVTIKKPSKPEDVPEEAVIKKPKPKEPAQEEVAVELTIKKPESTELIETSEKIILEKPKPQEPMVEEADQLTIKKEVVEETKEETAVTKTKKKSKKPKPDEPVEEVTIKKPSKPEDVPEEAVIKKPKPKEPAQEEVAVELTQEEVETKTPVELTIKKPESTELIETSEKIILEKPKPQEPMVEEADQLTIKKEVVEETKEDTVVTRTKKKSKKPEPVEQVTTETPSKPEDVPEKVEEDAEVTVTRRPKKPEEQQEEEFTIKKPGPTEDTFEDIVIKRQTPKQPTREDVEEEFTVKKVRTMKVEEPTESSKDVTIKRKKEKLTHDEAGDQITIKKMMPVDEIEEVTLQKEKPKEEKELEEEFTIKSPKQTEDVVQEFTIRKKPPPKPPKIEEHAQEVTIKKLKKIRKKPEIPEYTDVETVTFRPRTTRTKEDVEQEFNIQLDSYAEEEISMSGKVKLPKRRPLTYSEEAGQETIKIRREIEEEAGPTIEEIIDDGSDAEELPYDDEGNEQSFHVALRKKLKPGYSVHEEDEEEISIGLRKPKPQTVDYEEESLTMKPKRKQSQPTFEQEAASLSITRTQEISEEEDIVEVTEGDVLYSIYSYVAEADQAIDLVEGEKVYVLDMDNTDWWFVKKHLTEEKGWVPAQYLMDEANYTVYVQKKLHEKIDKLPVFEKPKPEEKPMAPRFIEKLQPQHTPDGYTVQFECQVEGIPRPQITWFRQTAIIKPSKDFQMYYDEDNVATLVIKEVFPEDAGTFTCVAKNSAGFASSTTELIVELPLSDHGSEFACMSRRSLSRESSLADILEGIPPIFSRKPKAQCVKENADVVIECRLVAVPEPEIKWRLNGKTIKQPKNVTIVNESDMHMYTTILKIKEVQKTQEGIYQVIAKNREGEASIRIPLKVKTDEKQPPQILEPLKNANVREGDTVILSTMIVGNPTPKITWHKNGKPLTRPTPKKDGDEYTLTFYNTTKEDTAEYTVQAVNPLGTIETTATLTVEECPIPKPEPPIFVERFQEQSVPEKGTITLLAKVIGNPVPEVFWLKNNEPLKPSPRIKTSYDGENIELIIRNADSEIDSGDYKCVAVNPIGKSSHGAKITVDVDIVTFTKPLKKTYEVLETESLTMECETSHTVTTKWWHNNEEISGMDHRVVVQEGRKHKLVVKNTTTKDMGTYKCTVKNEKTETTVTVKERKPEFVRRLHDLEITEKQTAVLEVEITSETANVIWRKDGIEVDTTNENYVVEKEHTIRRLIIKTTSIHDEGEYTCTLEESECRAEVTIIELPPEIISTLQDQNVNKGEKAIFEIELTKGDALVSWFKDSVEIQFSEHIQLSIDGKKQKLKIYNCKLKDAGTYSCQVGTQESSAKLTVNEPTLTFLKKLPEFTRIPLGSNVELIRIPLGSNVELIVELSRPDVNVKWLRDKKSITQTTRFTTIVENTVRKLIIKNVTHEDEFEYTCIAEDIQTSTKLIAEEKPSPPQGPLEVSGMTDTSFTLSWQPSAKDGGSPIIEYIVEMRESTKTEFKKIGATKEGKTFISVNYLEKDHSYRFRITARNEVGLSEPYEPSDSITAGSRLTPPSPPINLRVKEFTSRTCTIQWEPPEHNGGSEIIGYVIEKKLEYVPKWEKVVTLETFSLEYTIMNLKDKSDYLFRVFAENSVGLSVPATTDIVHLRTHATVPSPPTAPLEIRTIGPNAVVIEWGAPESDGGAPLEGYNIAIRDTKKTMWMEIGRVSKGVQKFTIRDLQEDHDYLIRIFARNEIGLSDPLESDEPIKVLPSGEAQGLDILVLTVSI
ncbi:Variant SH3 domain [Popillia japonica]|uniref:Variant SH3 domain n=1 Tax=Popillia japonica TaxID=7064 RepID=A0AAW1L8V1_POPJA